MVVRLGMGSGLLGEGLSDGVFWQGVEMIVRSKEW